MIDFDTFNVKRHGKPGVITTYTQKHVDLNNFKASDVDIHDIAHSLSTMVRFNGHIAQQYTVLDHSMLMSYLVPREYAMEALFHDAGEAYTGDIIYPLKQLFPQFDDFENNITAKIFKALVPNPDKYIDENGLYFKSKVISKADIIMVQHECAIFGRPDGWYEAEVEQARLKLYHDFPQYETGKQSALKQAFYTRYNFLRGLDKRNPERKLFSVV